MTGPAKAPISEYAEEKTLLSIRPTRFIAFRYYVMLIISLALAIVFQFAHPLRSAAKAKGDIAGISYDSAVAIFLLIVAAYCFLRAELKRYTTRYTITDNKIVRIDGLLNKNTQMIPFTQLNRVDLHQSIFQRMLKIGTLVIDTGDDVLKVEMISHPKNAQELISQRIGRLSYSQQH